MGWIFLERKIYLFFFNVTESKKISVAPVTLKTEQMHSSYHLLEADLVKHFFFFLS